ncbi:MAG: hypothetical protein PHO12_01650 [Bacteroidales bacterium]|nr:hypothetical protein [Bacteroidales bacterium]MDD4684428.1 hypothetical protein [Bacteroidales bacterium]
MKRLFLSIIICLFAFNGFSQNLIDLDDQKLTEFTNKLIALPFPERDVITKACEIFEKDFANDPYVGDWAFQILYYYHEISCEDKTNTLHKTFSDKEIRGYFHKDIWVLPKLKSNISSFITEYAKWGYRISSDEDTTYSIEVDSTYLLKRLGKLLSKDYSYYFTNYVADLSVAPIWHAELNIPIAEVMRRIEWRDLLLDRSPDFIRNDLVTREIQALLFIVTKGLEHTPIYGENKDEMKVHDPREGLDFTKIANETTIILPEYKTPIQTYYRAYPNTTWGLYLTDFMHRLALNKYRFSNEIDDFVLESLYPKDRKNIDPLLKYKDMLIDNLMD